jgi:nicotinamidase-related amidase
MLENKFRLRAEDSALVVIDMQERLVPAMSEMHSLIHRTDVLVRGCAMLGVPVIFTQQYTKGLGGTIEPVRSAYVESVSISDVNVRYAVDDQRAELDNVEFSYIEKNSFSAMDEPEFASALKELGREAVILCGIETHVCVMQSAEDIAGAGYRALVVADATSSRRETDSALAYSRMAREDITVTTSEALIFDLMKSSKHPMFKHISALVR